MSVDLSGMAVTVVGLGESGLAAARLLHARGARVTVNDARSEGELGERAERAKALGVTLLAGGHDARQLSQQTLIVVSPGVPPLDELDAAASCGVPIISEIELASRFIEAPIVAITGTNGKSTVTTLLGEMVRAAGGPTFVGGNLGTPLVDVIGTDAASAGGTVVVELSSFQLERVDTFRAHIAMLLNVSDDHLDRYADFEAYVAAKARIFERQTERDFACAPALDEHCLALARQGHGQVRTFGPGGDVHVSGGEIVDTLRDERFPLARFKLRGEHNLLNACAAVLGASLLGLPPQVVGECLERFAGLPHRMQWVASHAGVTFYDDSKATNVGAALTAVQGLAGQGDTKLVLIAGGKDKGGSYAPLVDALRDAARAVVVLGDAAPLIAQAVRDGSALPVEHAKDMQDAVLRAAALAAPGDAVLLAPACASFDMFRSYAHRGDVFQEAVRRHIGEGDEA